MKRARECWSNFRQHFFSSSRLSSLSSNARTLKSQRRRRSENKLKDFGRAKWTARKGMLDGMERGGGEETTKQLKIHQKRLIYYFLVKLRKSSTRVKEFSTWKFPKTKTQQEIAQIFHVKSLWNALFPRKTARWSLIDADPEWRKEFGDFLVHHRDSKHIFW